MALALVKKEVAVCNWKKRRERKTIEAYVPSESSDETQRREKPLEVEKKKDELRSQNRFELILEGLWNDK